MLTLSQVVMTTRPLPVHPQFKENAGSDDAPIKGDKKRGRKKHRKPDAGPKFEQGDPGEDTYDEYYEPDLVDMEGGFNNKLGDNVEPLNNDAAAEAAADLALSAIRQGRRNRGTPSKAHDYEKIAINNEGLPSPGRKAAAKIKRMSQEVKNWKETVVDGDQQGQIVHHEGRLPHTSSPSVNKNRKKRIKNKRDRNPAAGYEESGLDALIDDADLINSQPNKAYQDAQKLQAPNPSVIYVEKDDGHGFVKKNAAEESTVALVQQDTIIEYSTLDVSFSLQNWFYFFSLFIHGLLAGFSLWQTLQVYLVYSTEKEFLEEYKNLAWPAASAYFVATAICTVSSLDILEVAISVRKADIITGLLRNPIHTLTVVFYVLALILSCGLASIDDKLSLYAAGSSLWADASHDIKMWKIINLLRMSFSIVGFLLLCWCFMFSIRPTRRLVRSTARVVSPADLR